MMHPNGGSTHSWIPSRAAERFLQGCTEAVGILVLLISREKQAFRHIIKSVKVKKYFQ